MQFRRGFGNFRSPCSSRLWTVTLGIASAVFTTLPAKAADRIHFSYGLFERSLSVESLDAYAEDGTVNSDLAFFLGFLSPEARTEFRTVLNTTYDLDPVAVSHSFYEPMGERSLRYVGNVIQTGQRQNGLYALRSALVLAAAQPDGFTLIDVVRQFPTQGMRIDLKVLLRGLRRGEEFFNQTNAVIDGIEQLAAETGSGTVVGEPADLPNLREPGPFQFSEETITLTDPSRDRTYPADLYIPQYPQTADTGSASIPVVVLSHGLGSSRRDFADVARHFASYGFLVALPEHIGSNTELQQAVLAGRAFEVFRISEFVDRPLDVSFLLDELERRNQSEWQGRLNLQNVAVFGHSFGGYTALMLGGATVDFEHLRESCSQESFVDFLNPALLLQCRALELETTAPEDVQRLSQGFRDDRVGLVVAFNPVNAVIFGPRGLSQVEVPTVIGASGYDPAAPLIPEQAVSFTWLDAPEKYLLLVRGGAHIPQLTALINRALAPSTDPEQLQEDLQLFRSNAKALLLAFLQVYLADRPEYSHYLEPFNVETLGDPPFEFSLIRSLTEEQLLQMLEE